MECRAYAICMDSQSGGHLGQDRKVPSTAGGTLSRMHKTEKTAKESRMNFMYSHLCDRTLVVHDVPCVPCHAHRRVAWHWRRVADNRIRDSAVKQRIAPCVGTPTLIGGLTMR